MEEWGCQGLVVCSPVPRLWETALGVPHPPRGKHFCLLGTKRGTEGENSRRKRGEEASASNVVADRTDLVPAAIGEAGLNKRADWNKPLSIGICPGRKDLGGGLKEKEVRGGKPTALRPRRKISGRLVSVDRLMKLADRGRAGVMRYNHARRDGSGEHQTRRIPVS